MNILSSLLRFKKQGILAKSQCLSKIAAHIMRGNLCTCTRIPIRSLCCGSSSNEQFTDENKFKNMRLQANESWSKETIRLYNELCKQADESNGLWVNPRVNLGQHRPFHDGIDDGGKRLFEFYPIFNKTEQRYIGVCQFGPSTSGTIYKSSVHGGAISTMLDFITAAVANLCGYHSVTANLSVDFKMIVHVGSTVLLESKIASIEGRKIYVHGEIKSSDGLQLHATAKTLCIMIDDNSNDTLRYQISD